MEKKEAIANTTMLARQRNLFLLLTVMLSASGVGLTVKILMMKERTVMVPGLNQQVWVTGEGVSASYLDEMTRMYLPLFLDLNHEDIEYKARDVMKYVSQSDPSYLGAIQKYFAEKKEEYKKYRLWTAFKPRDFEIDSKGLTVRVTGSLHDMFGARGNVVTNSTSYIISYEWIGGKLYIKQFMRIPGENEDVIAQREELITQEQQAGVR